MATRNVIVNFLTKLQSKGIDQLNKKTSALNKSFKNLAVGLGGFLSLRQINRLAQQSVKAFIAEDKAVRLLATNLNNLNIAYDVDAIEGYIDALQRQSGVIDDQLRPAFQQLLITTRSVTKSQELLALSLDIAASTGNSLESVTRALSRSFLGSNTALSRLNVGISKADLSAKSFDQIVADLSTRFAGGAATAADTYAGKLDKLKISADEAQEVLGKKLVFAVELLLDSNSGIPALGRNVEKAASSLGDFTVGLAGLNAEVQKFTGGQQAKKVRDFFFDIQFPIFQASENVYKAIANFGRTLQELPVTAKTQQNLLLRQFQTLEDQVKTAKILKKEEAARARAAAKAEADKAKAKAKEQADARAEALRNRLEGKFDIDNINLAAAAQKNLSEADRSRVEALQALKTAGVQDDETALNKLIELEKKRETEIQRQARESIIASAAVKNQRLADLQAELDALIAISTARSASIVGGATPTSVTAPSLQIEPTVPANIAEAFVALSLAGQAEQQGMASLAAAEAVAQQITVIQNIAGNVTTERELFDTYVDAIFQINRQGTNSQLVNLGR